jgi:MinD-like ATPase involved in chromosome partitioning or flagellar assembly
VTQKNAPVCLFDLDFHTSHVCDYLDIEPRFDVKEVVGASHRLDAQLLEALASRHSSGLEVYAAPRDITRGLELSVEDLSTVLDLVAQRCGAIVIDLPVGRHSWTGPVLAASQGIIVTGRNTIPGLRQVSETLAAARRQAPQSEVRPAINNCDFGLLGGMARADHVARVLGDEKPFIVRRTHQALECVNAGTPISFADPSTRFVKDIAAIVDFCVGLKVPPAANADA